MFLSTLTIRNGDGIEIRCIKFHEGLNLIVDETPDANDKKTGNNVGKTTVLKLIAFCLGGKAKSIYSDDEYRKAEYTLVKDFLIEKGVRIELVLKDDLSQEDSREVKIERNFLARGKKLQKVDGIRKSEDEFELALTDILFPGHYGKKPTFPQIIAHNIRYKDLSINNTLKNLDRYTRDDEYEALYLFLFGCNFEEGDSKQELRTQIGIEEKFMRRLESEQTISGYETALALVESEIGKLEDQKSRLNVNPEFESDLNKLNQIKYQVNLASSEIGRLDARKSMILEAKVEMESNISHIDTNQLHAIYEQATSMTEGIQKSFDELQDFHNKMLQAKVKFITHDLPSINNDLAAKEQGLKLLLDLENILSIAITQGDSFEELEQLVESLNAQYQFKGEYEASLRQLRQVESRLKSLTKDLEHIDNALFSDGFALKIKEQINKFNLHFSSVSNTLYGEKYALKADKKTVKGRSVYEFTSYNTNFSSGKKQGEISCFDIAYTLFADEENIPCMHFLLNDKKELMHDNQLISLANFTNEKGVQFVASILQDKLPVELNNDDNIVVRLSQEDKLFRIEGLAIGDSVHV